VSYVTNVSSSFFSGVKTCQVSW